MVLMQSTGHTTRHASHPVHMSSSSNASVLGSFFLAIGLDIVGRVTKPLNKRNGGLALPCLCYRPFRSNTSNGSFGLLVAVNRSNIIIPAHRLTCGNRLHYLLHLIDIVRH